MSVLIMCAAFASLAEAGVQVERTARRGTQRNTEALTMLADLVRSRQTSTLLASDFSVEWHESRQRKVK